jgi:hypothetical protein
MSVLLPLVLLVYTGVAAVFGWWPSAIVAPVVAVLLWRRHPRARFTAYVFCSVLAARGALTTRWGVVVFALAVIGALQLPAARRLWPRITPGRPLR